MANMNVEFDLVWEECENDFCKCSACEDQILTRKYILAMQPKASPMQVSYTDVVLCESCYKQLKDVD
jgi:hypothetical protein